MGTDNNPNKKNIKNKGVRATMHQNHEHSSSQSNKQEQQATNVIHRQHRR
jgi:hypothetical protein